MYIYHFLVSWNGREFDYWHTNRVGSVLSAAHTFYVTPTSQRACALAFMSPFSTVSVFYVTPAAYINFNQNTHQIRVLTKPLCCAQAIFYSLPNNEWGTKYRGLTYRAKLTVREICRATYSARQARLRIQFSQRRRRFDYFQFDYGRAGPS